MPILPNKVISISKRWMQAWSYSHRQCHFP